MKETIVNKLKRLFSRAVPMTIEKGVGVSSDPAVELPVGTDIVKLEEAAQQESRNYGRFYTLDKKIGLFELVGIVKSGEKSLYRIRSIKTGDEFDLSIDILELLFEKV